jgi:glucose-1-phosphate thymidylyltransferase
MSVILFEDHKVTQLFPVTIGRPAFAISCGSYRLFDLVARLDESWEALVRPHLRDVWAADFPHLADAAGTAEEPVLLVNARLVPSVAVFHRLRRLLQHGRPSVVQRGEAVAAAILPLGVKAPRWDADLEHVAECLVGLPHDDSGVDLPLFEYPHDIIRHHLTTLPENLEERLARGGYREISDGVFVAHGATLGEHVVTDSTAGPIVLEENAKVGPYTFLSGPAHIGAATRIIEHSAIKDAVALGHTCKVGGEVEASTIEPFTNKQHHGFLGHSHLGSWVNLGAGTSNSDLKNTYGTVSMEYEGRKVATEMQFVGCIMGDYAKTAVNTSIFTGKTIGACSMVYGFVTTNVPSFVNYARSFGQITEVPDEVMIASQARMFKRRNVVQRPCDIQLLRDMHVLTRHERQIANEPLAL